MDIQDLKHTLEDINSKTEDIIKKHKKQSDVLKKISNTLYDHKKLFYLYLDEHSK